ncbi:uncharacterized protein LOC143888710 [Tasmannia lanceolata]|uniref:uncharacterized protein LOC143888710 n=1 Tax=Tasmannia lanceolata TaxID=3420 RepID=UPI0040644277
MYLKQAVLLFASTSIWGRCHRDREYSFCHQRTLGSLLEKRLMFSLGLTTIREGQHLPSPDSLLTGALPSLVAWVKSVHSSPARFKYIGGTKMPLIVNRHIKFSEFESLVHQKIGTTATGISLSIKCRYVADPYQILFYDIRNDDDLTMVMMLFENSLFNCMSLYITKEYKVGGISSAPIPIRRHDAEFSRDFHSDMYVSDGIECEDGNNIEGDDAFGDEGVRPLVGLQNVVGDPLCNTYTRESLEVDEMVVDELNEGRIELEEMKVGGIFPNLKVFKNKVKEYAIERKFVLVLVDSKPTKYAVRCKDKSCPFRISGRNYLNHVRVKRFVLEHTCSRTLKGNAHPLVTAAWAADTCLGLFPRPGDVRPTLIRAYIKDKWGITISYAKTFNAKVIIHEIMCGNAEASYRILPAYAQEIERCNPDTIMRVYRSRELWRRGDHTFGCLFWSFGPSIGAFSRTIRPLIDGAHLRGKYKGILLAVTAVDGDGGLFPLAYAVVENEMYESWLWFLRLLRQRVIPAEKNNNEFTISSDRMKGLPRAIDEVLPGSYHSYCIRHLNANFLKTFKSQILCKLFSRAVYALRERDYKETMECIKAKNAKAGKWISGLHCNSSVDSH